MHKINGKSTIPITLSNKNEKYNPNLDNEVNIKSLPNKRIKSDFKR